MIIVDSRTGSIELAPRLRHIGANVVEDVLESGDFAFEGHTAKGFGAIGVERKTVSDLLTCMKDGRYIDGQLPKMLADYSELWLLLEGIWYENTVDGSVTYKQGYQERLTRIPYTAFDKFLFSIQRVAGVNILQSTSPAMSARRILDLYHHCQKKMDDHSTFQNFRGDCNIIDTLNNNKSLVTLWAKELPGIGWTKATAFSKVFHSGYELATADPSDFESVKGVSVKMAKEFWQKIRGK